MIILCLTENRVFYTLELKIFEESYPFAQSKDEKGIIHFHQIESLRKSGSYQNVISRFALYFRKTSNTYFLSMDDFCKMIDRVGKKSFNKADMQK